MNAQQEFPGLADVLANMAGGLFTGCAELPQHVRPGLWWTRWHRLAMWHAVDCPTCWRAAEASHDARREWCPLDVPPSNACRTCLAWAARQDAETHK